VQPSVKVDGRETGSCKPNGVFYVDVRPGKHEVSARTEVTDTVTASSRRPTYIECSIDLGIVVGRPSLIEVTPSRAKEKIGKLAFTGKY
ncbi:MAG: hypothetical protein ACR2PM_16945, partial [Hyphomicrobiales bacterium]